MKENNSRGYSNSAINLRKTHCLNGHEYGGDTTYIHPIKGYRWCRTCRNDYMKAYNRKTGKVKGVRDGS